VCYDIATAPVAPGHRADVIEPVGFFIPYVFEQDLELLLAGHRFLRIYLQLGQVRVQLSTEDLRLFMVGTVKAE